ncbi:MAG: cytochrome c biogenesis protein, partial [Planctomycetota bacterium]
IPAAAAGGRWKPARLGAMGLLALSTAALLAGFIVRWILSGREWYLPPIMNQFEGVLGSALLASLVALGLEWRTRRGFYGLAASFYAAVSLLAGFLFPGAMGAGISAPMGILASPVMAVHVGVIIIGHAFAGMAAVISSAYLLAAVRGLGDQPSAGADLAAPAGGSALSIIDRCNLVVVQLATWTIALGTILGAWWADFAWNRWWGWDPKETWALLTALIFIVVVHVRFVTRPRHRGLVTAAGALLGCAFMLFNWLVVNFLLPGLHSYA